MGMECPGYQNIVSVFQRMLQFYTKLAKYSQGLVVFLSHHVYSSAV